MVYFQNAEKNSGQWSSPAGNLFEGVICNRSKGHTEGEFGLDNMQYDFRENRSTDAEMLIHDIARNALAGQRWRGWRKTLLLGDDNAGQ